MLDNVKEVDEEDLGTKYQYVPLPMGPSESDIPPFLEEADPIFEELPTARVVDVSRSERNDQSLAFQLVYIIELQYKQFTWRLERKATQLLFLHLALKKRVLLEEIQEKQEQIKEWAHSLGFGEEHPSTTSTSTGLRSNSSHDGRHSSHARHNSHDRSSHLSRERRMSLERQQQQQNSSHHDGNQNDENQAEGAQECTYCAAKRDIPSSAALPVMRPAIGPLPVISQRASAAMQNYLNHFLESLDIVNTIEVCKFLEVSRLSFTPEYGPKLQEGYVTVKHLPRFPADDERSSSCSRICESCWCSFNTNWQEVWAVLKPGFLVLLADPLDAKPLDIIVFDVLGSSEVRTGLN